MSIDYYVCAYCGKPFSDAGHFICCDNCGTIWCSDECAKADGYTEEHCNLIPELYGWEELSDYRTEHCNDSNCLDCGNYVPDGCGYCREDLYTSDELFEMVLSSFRYNGEFSIKKD